MTVPALLLHLLVFPGLLFLVSWSLALEWVDRKVAARMQSRVGPPPLQPLADFVKLLGKEVIQPGGAGGRVLGLAPLLSFASVATAFLLLPVSGSSPLGFQGDLVVALYLLTVPTVALLLVGWSSSNVFAAVGGVRAVTQMFIYEVPFYLALLGPALLAGSWSVSGIVEWQAGRPWMGILQPVGLLVGLVGLQAKLERTPFDIPEAETEIVAGPLTELTGRRLAVMHLAKDALLAAGCALLAALFLGGPLRPFSAALPGAVEGFLWFAAKTLLLLLVLSTMRAATARIRIDQLDAWGWKVLCSLALAQMALVPFLASWME
ncbi:MAG: NADH-quinone oxidoreductase subunit H [Planctomycetaceae bacterium]|nr:NADH-quinone oxidoreductase subunit H [Planctomycetota bacterium]NUN52693.1 NADH-quinone oxidoreductase subunit H [Planctomycetaceae bacterium]